MKAFVLRLQSPYHQAVEAFRHWKKSGGDMHWRLREVLKEIGCHRSLSDEFTAPPAPWVAKMVHGKRVFLRPKVEYPDVFGHGEDDVWMQFVLEPGELYEINEVVLGRLNRRRFRQVTTKRYKAVVREGGLEVVHV